MQVGRQRSTLTKLSCSQGQELWSCGLGCDSLSGGLGFESQQRIQDRHFVTLIQLKNCIVCVKKAKINEKEAVDGSIKNFSRRFWLSFSTGGKSVNERYANLLDLWAVVVVTYNARSPWFQSSLKHCNVSFYIEKTQKGPHKNLILLKVT